MIETGVGQGVIAYKVIENQYVVICRAALIGCAETLTGADLLTF